MEMGGEAEILYELYSLSQTINHYNWSINAVNQYNQKGSLFFCFAVSVFALATLCTQEYALGSIGMGR